MPRFRSASNIPMKVRLPHLNRYKSQLREALMNPALTEDQRRHIKERLLQLGEPKPYAALARRRVEVENAFASEMGIATTKMESEAVQDEPSGESLEDLLGQSKVELQDLATREGVEVKGSFNKTQIATAILASREG